MKKNKIYLLLLILGGLALSFNYWGNNVKTSILGSKTEAPTMDYSWLSTYEKTNKIVRNSGAANIEDAIVVDKEADERERFINSSYLATCLLFAANNQYTKDLEAKTAQVFIDNGFPADDQKEMDKLIEKYKDDEAFVKAVLEASQKCKKQ